MKIIFELDSFEEIKDLQTWLESKHEQKINYSADKLKISDLNLDARTQNCLFAENITTVPLLLTWGEIDLLKTPNIGKKSLDLIKKQLGAFGLGLGRFGTKETSKNA